MKKHAVVYDRASSLTQKDNWSREDAARVGMQLAEKHGFTWELRQEVESGEELVNRPVMKSILDDIYAGKIQAVIVQNFARLSRDEDGIDGKLIRRACMLNNCIIITPNKVYDFANDQDKKMSDIEFMVAGWHKAEMLKYLMQGKRERARQGGYQGGRPPLGYKIDYFTNERTGKLDRDLIVDEEQRETIEKIFELYIENGGNTTQTAIEFNDLGYKIVSGDVLYGRTLLRLIEKPIYAGFFNWPRNKKSRLLDDFEPVMIHRPELEIVSIEVWEQANELRKSRKRNRMDIGKWSKHPFSAFIVCPYCGGPMYGRFHSYCGKTDYYCPTSWNKGKRCRGKSYSARLVAEAIIPLTADLLQNQLGLDEALGEAVDKYGKTLTEAEIEQRIKAEQLQVREKKSRIVKAISKGILTDNEAADELDDLRAKDQRLERELIAVHQKEAIKRDYLEAISALQSQDIEATLWQMLEHNPVALRRLLQKIFESSSMAIEIKGRSSRAKSRITSYELTKEFKEFAQDTNSDQRGVIRPFSRLQVERPAANHIGDRLKRARFGKFEGRADRVSGGQAKERSPVFLK